MKMGICVTAIVFAFFWQCVQPVNFWNEQAVIESMTFNSQSISPQCQEHFQDFKTRLKKPKQLYQRDSRWALKMYDAYGKFPPDGLFQGNFWQLGSASSCTEVNATYYKEDESGSATTKNLTYFGGKYCLLQPLLLYITNGTWEELVDEYFPDKQMTRAGAGLLRELEGPAPRSPPLLWPGEGIFGASGVLFGTIYAKMGICLPDSCSTSGDVKEGLLELEESLQTENVTWKFLIISCQDQYDSPEYGTADIIMLTIFGLFGFFIMLGLGLETFYRHKGKEAKGLLDRFLLGFSPYSNTISLFSSPSSGRDHITCLNGIRFWSTTWVVAAHAYSRMAEGLLVPLNNQIALGVGDFADGFLFRAILNGFPSVDSFYTMSGLLVGYLTFKELDRTNGKLNIPLFYIHRYIRLSGIYALVILFHVSLLEHLPYGPNNFSGIAVYECKEFWWKNLLYVNNFFMEDEICLGQTWYLATDMQMFWASPLMIVPMWWIYKKWGKIWTAVYSAAWLVAFTTLLLTLQLIYDWPANDITDVDHTDYIFDNYYMPWCRCQPYICGIITGFVLHRMRGKPLRIHWALNLTLWVVAFATGFACIYGLDSWHIALTGVAPPAFNNAMYGVFQRLGWGAALSWLIFACAKGYGGWINSFLSWQAFGPLAKLSYSTYLVHISVITFICSWFTFNITVSHIFATIFILVAYALSTAISVPMFVGLELPLVVMEKYLFMGVFSLLGRLRKK